MYSHSGTQRDGEVHFGKEVRTTLADCSFGKDTEQRRDSKPSGTVEQLFYGAAHASVNLYSPLTEIKRGRYQVITGTLSNAQEIITLAAERTISVLFNILSHSFAAV